MPIAWSAVQTAIRNVVSSLTGIPLANVRWSDQDHPEDVRPFATLSLPASPSATVTQPEIRKVDRIQRRTVVVAVAADQAYTVTILGTPYAHVAAAETVDQIRDALVALIDAGADGDATATANPGEFTIDALEAGQNLALVLDPDPDLVELTVGPYSLPTSDCLEVQSFAVEELDVSIQISARYDDAAPVVTDHARALAARVKAGVWLPSSHSTLCAAGCPALRTGPVLDLTALLGAQYDTRATVDLVCSIPSLLAEQPGSIETADVTGTFTNP